MAHPPTSGPRPDGTDRPRGPRRRVAWLRFAVLLTAPFGLVCGGMGAPPGSPAPGEAPAELLVRTATEAAGPLSFPPPPDQRLPRPPLDAVFKGKAPTKVSISYPNLSDEGAFRVVGRTFRVAFDETMAISDPGTKQTQSAGAGVPAAPGTVKITPEVAHEARWVDSNTLEITAARQLQRDVTYQIEIAEIAAASGRKLAGGWKATFEATPSETVAGKVLGYVPEPGHLRTIAMHPAEYETLPRAAELSVLYDQPIDLGVARSLVDLRDEADKPIPFVLDHPRGRTFQGVRVDPRYVVLIRPATPLRHGQKAKLTVRDKDQDGAGSPRSASWDVSSALEHVGFTCGDRWDDTPCEEHGGGRLRMRGRYLRVRFSNPIDMDAKALAQRVQVTPKVRNLSVEPGWWSEGQILISGDFEASTSYDVFVGGVVDRHGNRLRAPVRAKLDVPALGASATMPEGVLLLDAARTKAFGVTTRNVAEGELVAWPVPQDDAGALEGALSQVRGRALPAGDPPIRVPFAPKHAARDKLVETEVDLSAKLAAGTSYVASIRATKLAHGAEAMVFPGGSEAARPNVALLRPGGDAALTVHARQLPGATLVHVARLQSGEPVAGAAVRFDEAGAEGAALSAKTDGHGVALLGETAGDKVRVEIGGQALWVPLGEEGARAAQLFPDLAGGAPDRGGDDEDEEGEGEGAAAGAGARRALVITDRGIYRPGSTMWIKASLRAREADRLAPVPGAPVRVRVLGPTGDEVYASVATTNDMGSAGLRFDVPGDAKLGRHQLRVESPDGAGAPLARAIVQIAEFEAPRFAVDVDASEGADPACRGKAGCAPKLRATIRGRYLFGAPMDGAPVRWTLRREPAAPPAGPLADAGLSFREKRSWYDDDRDDEAWTRAGEARLGADGTLALDQALPMEGARGPQAFVLEADVTDGSHRHIAGRSRVVRHPAPRYAGLRLGASWVGVGDQVPVELGVIDTAGRAVEGARVAARLDRVEWHYSQRRGPGGALQGTWSRRRTEAGRCTATSGRAPVRCALQARRSGDYEVTAVVDGRPGGSASLWAWRDGGDEGEARAAVPSRGRTIEIVADKGRYAPGDKAKLFVRNPYRAATAILTVEQGGLLEHRSVRLSGGATVLEVPLSATHAPHVHAAVTLLPIGERGEAAADYRIGAVRLPVALDGARLDVAIRSDRPSYEPGEEAEITIDVKDGGAPEPRAEIALAVVDEGVLRLTGFRAPDPVALLHPGHPLSFRVRDSREGLAELLERSHVAGDGGGSEHATIERTRKDFVETALWRPDLRTDASGRATVKFKLPDNLTQFRVMAVALDDDGKGASSESDFTVRKPLMLVPAVPRFARRGDRFEVAAMVHNNTTDAIAAAVRFGDKTTTVTVSGGGHARVGFPYAADAPGEKELDFAVADGAGKVRDRVVTKLRVEEPGLEERPHLEGSFAGAQEIAIAIPASVDVRGEESLRVQVGQHLWPELGARLDYLLGYPHGCVEQTTSSTLPLLAARDILPRIGVQKMSEQALGVRIRAGLERLATMRTPGGGLAYWPGGDEPNVYGTAYAMRAMVLAKRAGIEAPSGVLEGMTRWLASQLLSSGVEPEVKAAIAQSLGELGELPPSAADALWDTRGDQSVFGKASLAIALASLTGQGDRVEKLLDDVEASFDAQGELTKPPSSNDFHYYGSPTRSRAQAAIALTRLRRQAKVLPVLLHDLVLETESYTTQATSYALLAVASQLTSATSEGAPVRVALDGEELRPARDLGFGSKEYHIPLSALRGRSAKLRLASERPDAIGYQLAASWRRPLDASGTVAETRGQKGPSVYRVFTDAKGAPVDMANVRAGDVVRVALLVKLPVGDVERDRLGYVAVTDKLPAGLEPIQPDLATVASAPELDSRHPFASILAYGGSDASHVELRDDRVNVYFDRVWGDHVAATYLARATTPGEYALPPAMAELMYEGDGAGYSEAGRVRVQ